MQKKLPVGIENFEEFSKENFYYVDKTMLISDLLHNWGKVNLFTRPRRFGKSLNMSMLKAFFEIGNDPGIFAGLKITEEKDLCKKYMGKFPVISLSLKGVDGLNCEMASKALRSAIGMEALRFQFLLESALLSEKEKQIYRKLIEIDSESNSMFAMSDTGLADSLLSLSKLLFKHYGSKVILLIDEYDVPLDKAFQAGYYNEMVALLRNLFGNVLKSNDSLYFAVLTGCLRISKESIFTGLNNLKTYTITDKIYQEYFGFTDEEVRAMLAFYGLEDHVFTVKEWYDGYQFGNVAVYCPWDVINYCFDLLGDPEAEPENYWANTSGNAMVKRFIGRSDQQTRNEIERLISGESIVKKINQELTYNELDRTIDNLWSVLFTTGYLTQEGRKTGREYRLVIPNREIREIFVDQIQEWFKEETRAETETLERFCRAFPEGNTPLAEELLNSYLWKSISIRDTAVRYRRKENFFHGLLLGLLQYEGTWATISNAESGEGYSDILIETPQRIGIVIETKYAEDGDLAKGCAEAIRQISEKKYDDALKRDGMDKIMKYGIAFYKKRCKVVLE